MIRYLEDLKNDVRVAVRQFQRRPMFWGVIILTLVIGVAASTTIFAVVDAVLIKPLPYAQPERLVRLVTLNYRGEFFYLQQLAKTMDLAAYFPMQPEVTVNIGGEPTRLLAAGITAGLFDLLGVRPILGRNFTADEMQAGGPGIVGVDSWRTQGVIIVSAGVWQTYFGGSPAVIGRTISVEGVPHTIIGVMPVNFNFPFKATALWFPSNMNPADLWAGNVMTMVGRLRSGYNVANARQELRSLAPSLRRVLPQRFGNVDKYGNNFDVRPLASEIVGNARPVLLVLLAGIGVVLLVLCVNVANLLLARGFEREIATRAALGAGRRRLIRQLLTENFPVTLVAGALGILGSWLSLHLVVTFLPADLPRVEEIRIDVRVLLFALGISLLTSFAFGFLPAIRVTSHGRSLLNRGIGAVQMNVGEGRLTRVLATLEFSLAVVLSISAALLLQSLWNLVALNPGFNVDELITAGVAPPGFNQRSAISRHEFAETFLEQLKAMPDISSAALANAIPFDRGLYGTIFLINGREAEGTHYVSIKAPPRHICQRWVACHRRSRFH